MLPSVFIALAGATIVLGLAALWQSLRVAFGGGPDALAGSDLGLPERTALVAEKKTLLRTIKDIEFDKELGKISDEDFARLDKAYRRRAKRVLYLLDQDIMPFLRKAEAEVAAAMGEAGKPHRKDRTLERKKKKPDAPTEARKRKKKKKKKRVAPEPIELVCPQCATRNDADAQHCKECAARIAPFACPRCETLNDPDAVYCKQCAERIDKACEEPLSEASQPEEEE